MFFEKLKSVSAKLREDEKKGSLFIKEKDRKPDHKDFMAMALEQARRAEKKFEVPVGAVLVSDTGKVISKAHNLCLNIYDPTAHAEIIAIRKAGQRIGNYRLLGTTLYVTIEPCIMCMGAAVNARIKRIVFGAQDYNTGAAGSVYTLHNDLRLNHRIEIIKGVMADECGKILSEFFRKRR